jgi:pantoate--beta-alanine ligase
MNIVTNLKEWQSIRKNLPTKTIGFIPTMGNLHAGHLSLCERSKKENEVTIVSIFVNPTQFNQPEDFTHYPRTVNEDVQQLDVDYVLLPDPKEIYADHYEIQLHENHLSLELEGAYRPGHFTGMLTVVLKLLNLTQATHAYFGEKDFQQLLLVKKMAAALFLPTKIIGCETQRATDGLALSSRNSRLNPTQREKAAQFPALLRSHFSLAEITEKLTALGFKVDYITEKWQRRLAAVWIDDIRLIDNIPIAIEDANLSL